MQRLVFNSSYLRLLIAVAAALCASPARGDLLVASTARGGGALALAYDHRTIARATFSDSIGGVAIYTTSEPGFEAADGDVAGRPLYRLVPGTAVLIELVSSDGGRVALKVRGRQLLRAGDVGVLGTHHGPRHPLHYDPEYQLILDQPAGTFGEATLAFRLRADPPRYRPSRIYRIRIGNGHLPPTDLSPLRHDRHAIACEAQVATTGLRHARAVWNATASGTPDTEGRLATMRAEAVDALLRRCGTDGSGDYDATQLTAFLDFVRVRSGRLVDGMGRIARAGCRTALHRHARAYLGARAATLSRCVLAIESRHAFDAAAALALDAARPGGEREVLRRRLELRGAKRDLRTALACTDGGRPVPDDATMLGHLEQVRGRAEDAIARACRGAGGLRPPRIDHVLRRVACTADAIVSAALPNAKSDLGEIDARPSQGGRSLALHFPCLAGSPE
jgi:hypothetical protein